MQISKNSVVSIDYILTDAKGEILDQSSEGHPLAFIHGTGQLIPGLEKALVGKAKGDALKAEVPCAEAYGIRDNSLIQVLPKSDFEEIEELEVGLELEAESEDGIRIITVTKVEGDTITVDGNHPLAGVDLTFDVKIVDVREATQEELGHGHVHGPGGHHH